MKNKFFILVFILMIVTLSINSQDITQNKKGGYDKFLNDNIGKEVIVTINYVDLTMTGILLEMYEDGIVIESTILKQKIFIPKSSIAFIKVNIVKK